jgi:hypothetical protein
VSEEIYIQLTRGGSISWPCGNHEYAFFNDGALLFEEDGEFKVAIAKGGWEFAGRRPIDKTESLISDTGVC